MSIDSGLLAHSRTTCWRTATAPSPPGASLPPLQRIVQSENDRWLSSSALPLMTLLDPKWVGKIVKAHPSYSGTILTATYQIARDVGWSYFEKLAQQRIMQVQSATDPPKKLALGERAVMADGGEYVALQLKEKGDPLEVVYPAEGTPLIVGPNALFKNAPNPNAARLLQSYMFSAEGQQVMIDTAGMHSVHAQAKEKPSRKPLSQIKLMKDDAAAVERESENIKKRYSQIFKV